MRTNNISLLSGTLHIVIVILIKTNIIKLTNRLKIREDNRTIKEVHTEGDEKGDRCHEKR